MLSRVAESLFWIGRYVERADDVARILDAHVHHLLETAVDEQDECRALVTVMGLPQPAGFVDVTRLTGLLASDPDNPSSILSSLRGARENARGARESVSAEMWECLNASWHSLPIRFDAAAVSGPHTLFRYVEERAALFFGLADATMRHDDAFRFLILGRSLERVDMLARLLLSRLGQEAPTHDWITLLTSCSAHEAYLRGHGTGVTPRGVIEFLLRDRLFPRSVVHALLVADTCLAELDRRSPGSIGLDEASRFLGQTRTSLEYAAADDLLADLAPRLVALQEACAAASAALAARYFRPVALVEWQRESLGLST